MRCLVTGAAGFIGSSISKGLLESGAEVRGVDNLSTGHAEDLAANIEFIEADINDTDALTRACAGVDAVFHEAAIRNVVRSIEDPSVSHHNNATGTLSLLQAASAAKVGCLIYASSSSVYGDVDADIKVESLPPSPRSPYAVSKLTGEYYCRVWADVYELPTVSLRYFNVYGPGQHADSKYAAVFPAFVSALKRGEAPEVHWDGEQSRDFTYIDDVVAANLAAAERAPSIPGEVINIAGGSSRTINEVLKAVADEVGTWIEPARLPKRAGDVRNSRADISRAADLLGWQPQAEWSDSVKSTVAWFA